jgi:hypothetical protein
LQISPESVDWRRNLEDRLMLADSHLRSFWLTLFAKRLLPFVSQRNNCGPVTGVPDPIPFSARDPYQGPTAPLGRLTLELYRKCSGRMVLRKWRERRGWSSFDRGVCSESLANAAVYGFSIVTNCCRGTCCSGRESLSNGRARQPPPLRAARDTVPRGSARQPYGSANPASQTQRLHLGSGESPLTAHQLSGLDLQQQQIQYGGSRARDGWLARAGGRGMA